MFNLTSSRIAPQFGTRGCFRQNVNQEIQDNSDCPKSYFLFNALTSHFATDQTSIVYLLMPKCKSLTEAQRELRLT